MKPEELKPENIYSKCVKMGIIPEYESEDRKNIIMVIEFAKNKFEGITSEEEIDFDELNTDDGFLRKNAMSAVEYTLNHTL